MNLDFVRRMEAERPEGVEVDYGSLVWKLDKEVDYGTLDPV